MILIGGTQLTAQELPMAELMDYQVESEQSLAIKLKTVAKAPTCFKVYLHEDYRCADNLKIPEEVLEKISYFKTDADLLKILELGGDAEEEVDEFEKVEVPEFEAPEVKPTVFLDKPEEISAENAKILDAVTEEEQGNQEDRATIIDAAEFEEVDTSLPDTLLMIPNIGDDVDSLKVQLDNRQRLVEQKEAMIKELHVQLEDAYKLQAIQMMEIKDLYETKIEEANKEISELTERASTVQYDAETLSFLKFASYSKNYKAALRENFTDEEQKTIGRLHSKLNIFACSSGDSLYSMMKQVKKFMDKNPNAIVVDFSNDHYLSTSYKLQPKVSSMSLMNPDVDIMSAVKMVGNVKLIPTTLYNDISLLSMPWAKLLRSLDDYAAGKPIVLIFGNINGFAVRYTVAKLANVGKLFVFAKCTPIVLTALFGDVKFIKEDKVTIIALEYIDVVKTILGAIANIYPVLAFGNDVEWHKLDLKV